MNAKKLCTRAFTVLLVMLMVIGLIPMSVLAVTKDDTLSASLTEAKSYIDGITINNSSNDPETVVKNFGTHFTWDNEKRENSKTYLFDWSYYNGVVFEGIEYLYEVTGDETYKDYVVEYMSSMITSNGGWATCSNNSSKVCAGYNSTHGADCYKTASLLLDAYEMTGDKRYLTMAATLYADLDSAAANSEYNLKNAGNNYRHTWASNPTPDLWLDGLYMILPFRAEYAKYIGDTEELDLIVSRMQWVSDNMYNSSKGLFYHAADSATSNSGSYWLRAIGWYAAAIVDVMDSMDGENLEAMQAQLVKLVDGMVACQNTSNGMWLNNMAASESSTNPYETSGTALVCYAIMKAVNNGWLDESYAQYAILAFNGICNEKLSGSTLTDICFKGAPNSGNTDFEDNEGKGVGPFIMLYAEVLEYYNAARRVVYTDDIIQITATGVGLTAIDAKDVYAEAESKIADVIDTEEYFVAYDVELSAFNNFTVATYTMEIADGMPTTDLVLYHLADDGTLTPMSALMSAETDDYLAYLTFTYNTDGIFVYGTKKVVVEEDATLESLEITSEPEVNAYFKTEEDDNPALDITGLVVKATFSDGQTKTIEWNEFDETIDGYALSFDMTKVGEQDVTVSYTYGDVTKSDTFKITVFDTEIADETSGVVIAPSVPGVTEVTVADNSDNETVKAALKDVVTTFVSYDISLKGYTPGDKVVVTLPIPEGTVNPVVYYVPESGEAVKLDATFADGFATFVTDHFSTYAIGSRAANADEDGWVAIPGETKDIFRLADSLANGRTYVIVDRNTKGEGSAVNVTRSYNSYTVGSVDVEVFADEDGAYIEAPAESAQWTYSTSNYRLTNVSYSRYLRGNAEDLSTTTSTNSTNGSYIRWTYSDDSYGLCVRQSTSGTYRYLHSDFTTNTSSSNSDRVYIYVEDTLTTTGGYARLAGTLSQSYVVTENADIDDILSKVVIETSDDKTSITNVSVTEAMLDWDKDFDGTTAGEYTATVTYEGQELGTITVSVNDREITDVKLVGGPVEVATGKLPDYSDISVEVTYEDGETVTLDYKHLTFGDVDTSTEGTKTVEVTYANWKFDLEVIVSAFGGLEEATTYPEYPSPGAVRVDKTATHNADEFKRTGVTNVEIDVAGISYKAGVDVILVADISNSMAWKAGSKNVSPDEDEGETTKWQDLQVAAGSFIDTFLADDEAGNPTQNTVSFVMFGGYDKERNANSDSYGTYFDATQIVYTSESNITNAKAGINAFSITGNDTDGYSVTQNGTRVGTPQGGTNYDYAFNEAAAAALQIKADYAAANSGASYDESGRQIYILFMTDGAPDHYNQLYYKSRSTSQFDYYALYFNDTDPITAETEYFDSHKVPTYNTYNQRTTNGYYIPTAEMSNANWIDWIQSDSLYAAEKLMDIPNVVSITAVGFDLANGAFGNFTFGEEILNSVLKNLDGSGECTVFTTDDSAALEEFYVGLASELRLAGTNAVVHDTVGNNFSVQLKNYVLDNNGNKIELGAPPTITVKTYDLYPAGTIIDEEDVTGDRTGTSNDIEIVSFNEDGTEAYSTLIDDGKTNIMTTAADGTVTVKAKFFTYTKTADSVENFVWNIGDITDKEIALSFGAYLEGSMAGQRPEDVYYTNEEATIDYIDVFGKHAQQTFPIPGVAWGGASTTIRFYLVNHKGEPVNREGTVVPWANRVYVGDPVVVPINLNQDMTIDAQKIEAAAHVPDGFFLYDHNAYYEIQTTSSNEAIIGGIFPSTPSSDAYKTTGSGDTLVTQTGAQTTKVIAHEELYYTWSYVGFGVRWDLTVEEAETVLEPDAVVIDYGKEVQVDVLANDPEREGYRREIVGFVKYDENADLTTTKQNAGSATYTAENGSFAIKNGKVSFTPNKLISEVQRVFYVVKYTPEDETQFYYVWGQLDIIPATIMYYETNFADGVFNNNTWVTDANDDSTDSEDGPQNAVAIGSTENGSIYGYDTTYANDAGFSNSNSLYVAGQGLSTTYTTFTFTGRGFDIISGTGPDQGLIRVEVTNAKGEVVKTISVLNKSESNLILYQIPVVSVNDLDHGTYTVKISVDKEYAHGTGNAALDVLNRGNQFFYDAVRIYDPIDVKADTTDAATALAAYAADGEANNDIREVRALLIAANAFNPLVTDGVIFVDGKATYNEDGTVVVEQEVGMVDYKTVGPNNEVYLKGNQTIGFYINIEEEIPESIHIGAKAADGNQVALNVSVLDSNNAMVNAITNKAITTNTSMYYGILEGSTVEISEGKLFVMISNGGSGILSITDLKIGYGSGASSVAEIGADQQTLDNTVKYVKQRLGVQIEAANYDVISAEFAEESVRFVNDATLIVTTPEAVESIVVQNSVGREENITVESVEVVDGVKVWTVKMRIVTIGTCTFTVTGYSTDGLAGASAEAAIKVTIF